MRCEHKLMKDIRSGAGFCADLPGQCSPPIFKPISLQMLMSSCWLSGSDGCNWIIAQLNVEEMYCVHYCKFFSVYVYIIILQQHIVFQGCLAAMDQCELMICWSIITRKCSQINLLLWIALLHSTDGTLTTENKVSKMFTMMNEITHTLWALWTINVWVCVAM